MQQMGDDSQDQICACGIANQDYVLGFLASLVNQIRHQRYRLLELMRVCLAGSKAVGEHNPSSTVARLLQQIIDDLEIDSSRRIHETTTSFGQPYRSKFCELAGRALHLPWKRTKMLLASGDPIQCAVASSGRLVDVSLKSLALANVAYVSSVDGDMFLSSLSSVCSESYEEVGFQGSARSLDLCRGSPRIHNPQHRMNNMFHSFRVSIRAAERNA